MKVKGKANIIRRIFVFGCLLSALPFIWLLTQRLEGSPPVINLNASSAYINLAREFTGTVSDTGRGLRRLRISLRKDSKEFILLDKPFPSIGFRQESGEAALPFSTKLDLKEQGSGDGPAMLYLEAWDHAFRNWGGGNHTVMEKAIIIDTMAPRLEVLSRQHNVNQGGSGLAVYRVSEPDTRTGVVVGENLFPGYAGYFKDPLVYMAFFALGHLQGPGTAIQITAVDQAGNSARSMLANHIKKKKFKQDTIVLSDDFLQQKMLEFDSLPAVRAYASNIEKFLVVNRSIREENERRLIDVGATTVPTIYWETGFLRLPRSAPRAEFADYRSYEYNGQIVDHQYHLGVDLASLERSPVPAANRGKVVFIGDVGIYGSTVVIDHGFGLFSLYSHLSSVDVKTGDEVQKGHLLGLTGNTGLAGGDHLHYGMMVHNTLVNPLEWWDESWIENNVTSKINEVQSK